MGQSLIYLGRIDMILLIVVFGVLILSAGCLLLKDPEIIISFLRKNVENPAIHILAVVVRLIFGMLLFTQARFSKFQVEVEVLGLVLIVAGILLAAIGRKNFRQLMARTLNNSTLIGRFSGVVAIVFGGLLVYVFV